MRDPTSNLTKSEDFQPIISYRLVSHAKPLGPIKREIDTFKVRYIGYFGTLWMTLNEELQGQISASL